MQLEIEMKAWVRQPAALLARLAESDARFVRAYHKEDRYFRTKSGQDVRIRIDGAESIVTFKDKRLEGGLEVNDEHEFTVSDPAVMAELLQRLGADPLVQKIKTGQAWLWGDLLLELSEIRGLGHFIELERVVDLPAGSQDEQDAARQILARETNGLIRTCLAELGLSENDIESRSYTSMLLAAAAGA